MTTLRLFPLLLFVSCSLKLDAGRLRSDVAGAAGTAGVSGAAGAAGVAGGPAEPSAAGAAGAAGDSAATGDWSEPDLARLGFVLLGTAKLGQSRAVLTTDGPAGEVGGIAQRDPVLLGTDPALHVVVRFRIESTMLPGDGLAIVLHASPTGYTALGMGGGGLGYGGLSPCIAIEVDILKQVDVDPPAPHLAFMPGCNSEQPGAFTPITGNPADGNDWRLTIDWNPQTALLEARLVRLDTEQETAVLSEPTELLGLLGEQAFVAVTAATGANNANHSVMSLQVVGGGLGSRTVAP